MTNAMLLLHDSAKEYVCCVHIALARGGSDSKTTTSIALMAQDIAFKDKGIECVLRPVRSMDAEQNPVSLYA